MKKKYIYLEVMRIIAILFVIFNHTGSDGYFLFAECKPGSAPFWVYLFVSIFCKFSVPLFLAISGALMLGKDDESIIYTWKSRVFKMVFILILVSTIYYFHSLMMNHSVFNLKGFVLAVFSGGIRAHLWYIYAYIAFLISLPFLKVLAKNLRIEYFYYMIGIAIMFLAIVPIAEYILWRGNGGINSSIKVSWLCTNIVLYPCVGYFLQNEVEIKRVRLLILWLINCFCVGVSCYMTYYRGTVMGTLSEDESQMFFNSFALINCITVFLTIKYVIEHTHISKYVEKVIISLGECTFGIYLIHLLIKDRAFVEHFLEVLINLGINHMIAVWLQCLVVFGISYVIIYILRKIPGVKKLL